MVGRLSVKMLVSKVYDNDKNEATEAIINSTTEISKSMTNLAMFTWPNMLLKKHL